MREANFSLLNRHEWLSSLIENLSIFTESFERRGIHFDRKLAVRDPSPLPAALEVGLFDFHFQLSANNKCRFSQILIIGEIMLESNEHEYWQSWHRLARYAAKVFASQSARRFVVGFSLTGAAMTVWSFDRMGGVASIAFDINKEPKKFISVIFAFLGISEDQLGFPSFPMQMTRDGREEEIICDALKCRSHSLARGTVCWEGHAVSQPDVPLIVKQS